MTYPITFHLENQDVELFLREVGPQLGNMTVRYISEAPLGTTLHRTPPPEVATAAVAAGMAPGMETPIAPKPKKAKRKPARAQKKRASKVNDTILRVIGNATATVREMKEALADAGLSPGSLSTGLAVLQKEGTISRAGDGRYELTGKPEAAPEPKAEAPADAVE